MREKKEGEGKAQIVQQNMSGFSTMGRERSEGRMLSNVPWSSRLVACPDVEKKKKIRSGCLCLAI